jgi:branched-chain amino acid aminotransferase
MQTQHSINTKISFTCWKNGELVGPDQAVVSIFDHGLLYGDGCFEGLRFYYCQPFRLQSHLDRLRRSLCALDITIPFTDEVLSSAIMSCIDNSVMSAGYIRILVTRGEGDMGLNPLNCGTPNVFIIPASLSLVSDDVRTKGVSLITSSIKRSVGTGLDSRVKSLNYLHSILARVEANSAGADEAILLNQHGYVAECSAENIFIYNGHSLITPPLQDGALGGITRELLMDLASHCGIICREQSLTSYDLYTASECFICGSGARIIAVREIDGRKISNCPGDIYQRLYVDYQALINKECKETAR